MPNPWASSGSATAGGRGAATGATGVGGGGNLGPSGINTPAMQSLMQQMSENPALMQNLLNAPYTRTLMESMAADPNMAANVSLIIFLFFYNYIFRYLFINSC